jgi:PAS domain S-box-containing protein
MKNKTLRVLIVENSEEDAILLQHTLRHAGYEVTCEVVDTPETMRAALVRQDWDVITSDHAMPRFSAQAALAVAKELRPDTPFIIVSGEIDLQQVVSLLKDGSHDYIRKSELVRLGPVIERELREVGLRRERQLVEKALRVSETRYRRLFEAAQDGILILDADSGLVIDVNPFLTALLGYSKEEFLGKKLWELGTFKDIEAAKVAYLELQDKGYVRYEDLPLKTGDGRDAAVEFISNVYLVDNTKIAQCNIRDISARERATTEIKKLNREIDQRVQERVSQLESLNKELETFNDSVSHDLRAPLRRIKGFTDILQEDYTSQQSGESLQLLQNIRVSVDHMDLLIGALLKLGRFSHGTLNPQPVDLSALVHLISAELQQNYPDRQVKFMIAEGITVNGDDQLLRIVLENLLSNAWKFTSRRALAEIEFGVAPQPDGSKAYFVRDNGAGFNMDYAYKLFGAFQRLHNEKEFPGIGIGLATVQRIIHRHGGKVWAEGVVGEGATFYFTIGEVYLLVSK